MRANHRRFAIGLGVAAGLGVGIALWRPTPPAPLATPSPADRAVEFAPLATRSDSAPAQAITLRDAPEAPPTTSVRRVRRTERALPKAELALVTAPESQAAGEPGNRPLIPIVAEAPAALPAEAAVALYVPGCVGYAKRMWASGVAGSGSGQSSPVRNCNSGPPREIDLDVLPSGICANPERDRGLPAMCAQAKRRR